jgi:hypothetical protein
VGQQTDLVLRELLGAPDDELASLHEQQIIR